MHLILSIETATRACSVALHENGVLLASQELIVDKSHSEYLAPMIKGILEYTGKAAGQLSAVAVSKGPGSYTGLRIGVSTAKGMCFGLNIPLLSVNTLLAMAFEVNDSNISKMDLCPMIDARRMEVYYLIADHQLSIRQKTEAMVINESSFGDILPHRKILFFGDGMPKCRPILQEYPNAFFIPDIHPRASAVGALAYENYKKEDFENTETFEPFYLKDFIATKPRKLI